MKQFSLVCAGQLNNDPLPDLVSLRDVCGTVSVPVNEQAQDRFNLRKEEI